MLLKEILLDANLLVPNSLSDEIKVRWLNEMQAQLYRDFAYPNTSKVLNIESGVNLYPLPWDCSRERITSVIIGDYNYEYRTLDQDVTDHCWTIINGLLFIHPVPSQQKQGFLNYRPGPMPMRIDMQEEEPQYPKDFHQVLVYGIASQIARSQQNMERSLELKAYGDELHEKAQKELRAARNKTVQINRTWR